MRIEWECGNEKGEIPCPEGTFCVGFRLSSGGMNVSALDMFEFLKPEKQAKLGFACRSVEQILPNGVMLHLGMMTSDAPVLREITRKYAGEVYADVTAIGARIIVINE